MYLIVRQVYQHTQHSIDRCRITKHSSYLGFQQNYICVFQIHFVMFTAHTIGEIVLWSHIISISLLFHIASPLRQ